MGTDIHLQVQGRLPDGTWEFVKRKPFLSYDDEGFTWEQDPTGRNYDLFALLAGVRNGYGFAGVYRHEPVTPQFPKRGFPEDYVGLKDRRSGFFTGGDDSIGDHSFTWATLEELRAVPWDLEYQSGGVIGPETFKKWDRVSEPEGWSGGIAGPGIKVHDNIEEFEKLISSGEPLENENGRINHYCHVTWTWQPLSDCTFRKWIHGDVMQSLADEYGGAENIRVLMGFDS
jgi:hypothetical protein